MKHGEINPLFLPTVKRVGEAFVTYMIKKGNHTYTLFVSSTEPCEGEAYAEDIAQDRSTAERIKKLLADNLVSPLHVSDVLEDLLAQGVI